MTEKATEWIESRGENPFFLYFATTNVHHPFTPAERFQGTSECGVYGDFVQGRIWSIPANSAPGVVGVELLDTALGIAAFAEDNDGELYVVDYGGGVYRFIDAP